VVGRALSLTLIATCALLALSCTQRDPDDVAIDAMDEEEAADAAEQILLTTLRVLTGRQPQDAVLETLTPECRETLDETEVRQSEEFLARLHRLMPSLTKFDADDLELRNPHFERTPRGFRVTTERDEDVILVVDGKEVEGLAYLKSLGLEGEASSEVTGVNIHVIKVDGETYDGDCPRTLF
jgi:hypothetical protein